MSSNDFVGSAVNDIVNDIIRIRKEKGITQKQLAELSGVKQPIIARIETRKVIPQLSTIMSLLMPLGYTVTVVKEMEKL